MKLESSDNDLPTERIQLLDNCGSSRDQLAVSDCFVDPCSAAMTMNHLSRQVTTICHVSAQQPGRHCDVENLLADCILTWMMGEG